MGKTKTMAFITVLLSINSFAGDNTLNAAGRVGLISKDNDTQKSGNSNSSSFNIDFLRTTFAGSFNPTVKYILTTDLLSSNSELDSTDNTSSFVDEAFITKSFPMGLSVAIGKKTVIIGGREYDYADYDRYTSSSFKLATPANQVGLTLSQDISDQTFMIQYFNGNKNNGKETTTNAQSKFGYSASWYGNIQQGFIKPIIAYTVIPKTKGDTLSDSTTSLTGSSNTTRANSGNDEYLSAGLQFNLAAGFTIEGDYDIFNQKNAELSGTEKKDVKINSIVGLVRFSTERFAPFAKFITETRKTDATKTAQRTAYDLGLEFKESKDDAIRWQVVYSSSTVKTEINTAEVKSSPSSILVGMKFNAAML